MTIIELIERIGMENIQVQPLMPGITKADTDKRGVTRITFETDAVRVPEVMLGTGKCALVLWVDREIMRKAGETKEQALARQEEGSAQKS